MTRKVIRQKFDLLCNAIPAGRIRLGRKFLLIILVLALILPLSVSAHPGRTNASGCHTCKTNCGSWGLKKGEYHCHGGNIKTAKTEAKTLAKSRIYCEADIYNCSDFSSQEEAQLVYNQCFKDTGKDVHGLMREGEVCGELK